MSDKQNMKPKLLKLKSRKSDIIIILILMTAPNVLVQNVLHLQLAHKLCLSSTELSSWDS